MLSAFSRKCRNHFPFLTSSIIVRLLLLFFSNDLFGERDHDLDFDRLGDCDLERLGERFGDVLVCCDILSSDCDDVLGLSYNDGTT